MFIQLFQLISERRYVGLWISLNMDTYCREDITLCTLPPRLGAYISSCHRCHMFSHSKRTWFDQMVAFREQSMISCEVSVCTCWLGHYLSCQPPDTNGLSNFSIDSLLCYRLVFSGRDHLRWRIYYLLATLVTYITLEYKLYYFIKGETRNIDGEILIKS